MTPRPPADPLHGKTLFVGIGAQKAGTTWLHVQLAKRPDVYLPSGKELHYFDVVHRPDLCARFAEGLEERLAQDAHLLAGQSVPGAGDEDRYADFFRRRVSPAIRLFGEITPAYAVLRQDGFEAIRRVHDTVRILFVLRDPVERLAANVRFALWRRERRLPAPDDYLAALDDPMIEARGRYDRTLETVDQVFAPADVMTGFYEQISAPSFQARLGDFLGLDRLELDPDQRVHASPAAPPLEEAVRDALRRRLAPVYDACRARFGAGVPAGWMA
jgi:hypothetical protein